MAEVAIGIVQGGRAYAPAVPALPDSPRPRPATVAPSIIVLGDLALDVVLAPARLLEAGTDVPGSVMLRQGGSAANVARGLARLGVRTTLVCAVGRDGAGRVLVATLRRAGVTVHAAWPKGVGTARIGAIIHPASGERLFVADRGAADCLDPAHLDPRWFVGAAVFHIPAYSLLGSPLADTARAAIRTARAAGGAISVDLASAAPLLSGGRAAAHALIANVAPDLLLTNANEATAFLGVEDPAGLLRFARLAIVKRGAAGAIALARAGELAGDGMRSTSDGLPVCLDVATRPLAPTDTTGAGDAFDAGFLAAWSMLPRGGSTLSGLRRAVTAGNRAAARHLSRGHRELRF